MISSIGASIVMVSIAEAVFGVNTRRFPDGVLDPHPFFLGRSCGLLVSRAQILIHAAALVLTFCLGLFIRRTPDGQGDQGRRRETSGRPGCWESTWTPW